MQFASLPPKGHSIDGANEGRVQGCTALAGLFVHHCHVPGGGARGAMQNSCSAGTIGGKAGSRTCAAGAKGTASADSVLVPGKDEEILAGSVLRALTRGRPRIN